MNPIRTFARHPYLNTLAAAILIVLLIGSFALSLHLRQGTTTGSPAITHGWSVLATFSGTGNKTIAGLDIEVGHKYGWLINCTNASSDIVTLKINEQDAGGPACPSKATEPFAPMGSYTSPASETLPPVLTIQVTAAASTSWTLILFKGTYYPPLNISGPDFHALHDEMDGTGNGTVLMDVTLPGTFALGFVCHGTGTFKVDLPNIAEYTSLCDGQPQFNVDSASYVKGSTVSQIQITTGPNNDWQVMLVGCTNDLPSCGIGTVTP